MFPSGWRPNPTYDQHGIRTYRDEELEDMTATVPKNKKRNRKQAARERSRMRDKANSPGVPSNTCPYIDVTITMVQDLQEAYEKYRVNGHHNPMVDKLSEQAKDMLEYVRTANETLRDNSAYWYEKYKALLAKK